MTVWIAFRGVAEESDIIGVFREEDAAKRVCRIAAEVQEQEANERYRRDPNNFRQVRLIGDADSSSFRVGYHHFWSRPYTVA